jgi:hypothetical protein
MHYTQAALSRFSYDEMRMHHERSFEVPEGVIRQGRAGSITFTTRENHVMGKTAEVRHYSGTETDDDGSDPRLLDWYVLWSPEVTFLDNYLSVTGFMLGVQGRRQDGLCPKHQDPYCADDEEGEVFERVQFTLR